MTPAVRSDRRRSRPGQKLFEVADISGDRGDLLFDQLFGDQTHDLRIVRIIRVLPHAPWTSSPAWRSGSRRAGRPGAETGQCRGRPGRGTTLRGRNLRAGNAFMVDLFPFGHEALERRKHRAAGQDPLKCVDRASTIAGMGGHGPHCPSRGSAAGDR